MSCTECGRKDGCSAHKGGMFAAIDEALGRLYPTRRWAERDEEAAFGAGISAREGAALAAALAARLKALALHRPGTPEETCDYVYVLCLGRAPSLLELREGLVAREAVDEEAAHGPIDELYLRVALSTVARFAAVQEVAFHAEAAPDDARTLVITEAPRTGVFDPVLLPRLQKLVAVLAEQDIRHLDFGEIVEPPAGFDPGDYAERYGGGAPAVANYIFFPHPAGAATTTTLLT
jgi:hypothetical protein